MKTKELLERVAGVDPAALADADKQIRVMAPEIRPIRPGLTLLGRAYTVRCHEDFLAVIAALDAAAPGDVLVIDTQGSRAAVVGELFSVEAARRGLAGIVIDGACRDISTIRGLDMPVCARLVTPVSGTVRKLGERQIPVICGGVEVCPGDIVFGDDDGIVVASKSELTEIVAEAEAIKRLEQKVLSRLAQGTSLLSLLNFTEHQQRVAAGDKSSMLEFLL